MLLIGLVGVWLLLGLRVRPCYRDCASCGFRYAVDDPVCGQCGKRPGAGRRLLAVVLWPFHYARRVLLLRAMPPLHSAPGRIVPAGTSALEELRRMPADPDDAAESALLGALILEPQRLKDVGENLPFSSRAHAKIFDALLHLSRLGRAIDLEVLTEYLRRRGLLEEVGGATYLARLTESVPTPQHARHYAELVLDRALTPLSSALKEVFREVERRHDAVGLLTGFSEIDRILGGLRAGGLYAIGGRPSMGSTALALSIVEHAALALGKSVLIVSPELAAPQIAQRLLASRARVRGCRVQDGQLNESEYGRLVAAAGEFHEARIFVEERSEGGFLGLSAAVARRKRSGLDLVVVDALHILGERSDGQDIARLLKKLAIDLDVPIVTTAPVRRRAEGRPYRMPKPQDLRGVGSLETTADALLFLYRDEYYDCNSPLKGICEVDVARNRLGLTSLVTLLFHKEFARFEDPPVRP